MTSQNIAQRRSDLLAESLNSRVQSAYQSLVEPEPAFQVKKPEFDQVRQYVNQVQNGQLRSMRKSNGGPYDDEQVDSYVSAMDRLIPKYAPKLYGAIPSDEPPPAPEF